MAVEPATRGESFLKWLIAVGCGCVVPAVAFDDFLARPWNFPTEPVWVWPTISLVPLASIVLLFLPSGRVVKVCRLFIAIFAVHAALMLGLRVSGRWLSIAGAALFIDVLLIAAVFRSVLAGRSPGRFSMATIFWIGALFGVGLPLAFANSFVVAWRAEAIAAGRPYCIQRASQTDPFAYEPAQTLFDLSVFKMQARIIAGGSSSYHFQNHAVLVINDRERQFLNWSYGQEKFLDEVLDHELVRIGRREPDVVCRTAPHYAKLLPVWWHSPGNIEASIAGRRFSIPEAYRPRMKGEAIIINAASPDFVPYDLQDKNQSHIGLQFSSNVTVTAAAVDLAAILKRRVASFSEARNVEPEFDLNRTQLYLAGAARPNEPIVTLYTGYDDTGKLTRIIDCGDRSPGHRGPACHYRFAADGLLFELMTDNPSQWSAVDRSLRARMVSFEARPPN
jgi:hypothetical protein